METNSRSLYQSLYLGAIQGAVAWSAYAVGEFFASSVLFRLVRPYAVFTSWHWQMTALLIAGYLGAGLLAGAAAGLAINLLIRGTNVIRNSDTSQVFESAATFSLALCFGLNMLACTGRRLGQVADAGGRSPDACLTGGGHPDRVNGLDDWVF